MNVTELARYLTGKKEKLDFVKPEYEIERIDSYGIREKILNISYVDWKKLGFSKGTLNYMKQNAKSDKPFTLNSHFLERVIDGKLWFQVKSKNVYVFTVRGKNVYVFTYSMKYSLVLVKNTFKKRDFTKF